MSRRDEILTEIKKSDVPVSAGTLAKKFHVSRQIIVGDVALLRAEGNKIIATPRGYVLEEKKVLERKIAVCHTKEQIQEELYTIVDMGGFVKDVIVEHEFYGELCGKMHIASRYDVDCFLKRVQQVEPLSHLTHGLHLHTITFPDEETFHRIEKALEEKGFLYHA